ncbi:MAG: hypothetical protein WDN00_19170 [Limisphaerales bacterium]
MIAPAILTPKCCTTPPRPSFHYFKKDLDRETVTVGEFAGALKKVLRNLGHTLQADEFETRSPETIETDLGLFARQAGDSLELFFFPLLRDELRAQLRQSPRMLRFRGTARLCETACRRPALERALRTDAGTDRQLPARVPHRRAGTKELRIGRGMICNV